MQTVMGMFSGLDDLADAHIEAKSELSSIRSALAEKTAQVEMLREAIDDWGCKHDHPSITTEIDEALTATASDKTYV